MRAFLITHTHWDREWYRTFQAFRARLVDAVDRVLDLCAQDPAYRFVLDGQSIVLEDYAAVRPERADELRAHCRAGAIAVGPWYVQPDSLLPSGESHVRNLLEGRRVAREFGGGSQVAYTPDSFGHPAQFPQLFAGFGLRAFVYWRGNGAEIDTLPTEYDWIAPDGSRVLACHLARGYFGAASDAREPLAAVVERVARVARELAARTRTGAIALMNGIDHAPPEPRTAQLASALSAATGQPVERALLDDYVLAAEASGAARPEHRGELLGARVAPLLPGVWSTRSWIKLANRACEAELLGWAEPFAALAERSGARPERAALRLAWRELLPNHAHDSLCGCSRDEVHEQMRARFAAALELARETTGRCLEHLSGLAPERRLPWSDELDLAVFNPSPFTRSDVVRFAWDPHPFAVPGGSAEEVLHPLLLRDLRDACFDVDGMPARVVASEEPGRLVLLPERVALDVEFVARDVPALGWRRVQLRRSAHGASERVEAVEAGSADAAIACDERRIAVRSDGCIDLRWGEHAISGLLAVDDLGDRGDSYDFDPAGECELELAAVAVERVRHASGISRLRVVRRLLVPARLEPDRETRASERAELVLSTELRLAPDVPRVDVDVRLHNTAQDHRLRLLFPLGGAGSDVLAATTFDVVRRRPGADPRAAGVHPAPTTFPLQGFARAGALAVAAWGLTEAEIVSGIDGATLAVTLVRCVGSLSRGDLRSRPGPAGPGSATPSAQCAGELRARLALFVGVEEREVRAAELGLRAVAAGAQPPLAPGRPSLELEPAELVLSGLKPAECGRGWIARVLNPTDRPLDARLHVGVPFDRALAVRLDETELPDAIERHGDVLELAVPAHALRSVWLA